MQLNEVLITDDSYICDIVTQDYRTSGVFLKYGIDYCCGGKLQLREICDSRGLSLDNVKTELHKALQTVNAANSLDFNDWDIDFLIDYIEYVHHHYLKKNLSSIEEILRKLIVSLKLKNPSLLELAQYFASLRSDLMPHLEQEEKIIFPYIKQVAHAYKNKDSYARLLVRTLRKPVENIVHHEDEKLAQYLHRFRKLTNNYTPPPHSSSLHKACYNSLKELDADLMQHIHLENNILFPKALAMERELLAKTG